MLGLSVGGSLGEALGGVNRGEGDCCESLDLGNAEARSEPKLMSTCVVNTCKTLQVVFFLFIIIHKNIKE